MRHARTIPTLVVAGTLAVGSLLGTSAAVLPSAGEAPASAAVATHAETQAGEKVLDYRWEQQSTAYNCGPFAMRIALSAFGHDVAADDLAAQAGTTEAGTNFGAIEPVMNARLGSTFYETKGLAETPTQEQKDLFWHDVQYDIDRDHPVIVNIMTAPDASPDWYPKNQGLIYHFFTVVGYDAENRTVKVADPANFGGVGEFWLPADQVALMAGGRGYIG